MVDILTRKLQRNAKSDSSNPQLRRDLILGLSRAGKISPEIRGALFCLEESANGREVEEQDYYNNVGALVFNVVPESAQKSLADLLIETVASVCDKILGEDGPSFKDTMKRIAGLSNFLLIREIALNFEKVVVVRWGTPSNVPIAGLLSSTKPKEVIIHSLLVGEYFANPRNKTAEVALDYVLNNIYG